MILQAKFCILWIFFWDESKQAIAGEVPLSTGLSKASHEKLAQSNHQPVTTCHDLCGAFVFDDFDLKGARGRCLQRWTRFHRNCSLLLKAGFSVKSSRLESATSVRDQCRHFAAKADDSEAVKIH